MARRGQDVRMNLSIAHPRRHLVPAVVGLLTTVATGQAAILTLAPDLAQSTAPYPATSVAKTLDDPFAYNPLTPTAQLPDRSNYTNGFHGNSGNPTIAYTLGDTYENLFIDLYGRNTQLERDNDITIRFYSGSWLAGDLTQEITGFAIADASPYHGRVTAAPGTEADRFSLSSPTQTFFTIQETRANGTVVPEPTAGLLLLSAAALLGVRRRSRSTNA